MSLCPCVASRRRGSPIRIGRSSLSMTQIWWVVRYGFPFYLTALTRERQAGPKGAAFRCGSKTEQKSKLGGCPLPGSVSCRTAGKNWIFQPYSHKWRTFSQSPEPWFEITGSTFGLKICCSLMCSMNPMKLLVVTQPLLNHRNFLAFGGNQLRNKHLFC